MRVVKSRAMREELEQKVAQSIKLLQVACKGKKVELAYSGGKDSDVILQLAKEAEIDFVPIYKMTTIDPPGTIQHAKENGCKIRRPEKTFFQLVREKGLPSRFARFCCAYLKEYKIMDNAILGVRRAESVKRAKRYKEPTQCRTYRKGEHVNQIFPILEWTNDDIKNYIIDRGIRCHPLYYDDKGEFRVKRRLGCIGCPLNSNAKDQFKMYPRFVKAYIDAVRVYYQQKRADMGNIEMNIHTSIHAISAQQQKIIAILCRRWTVTIYLPRKLMLRNIWKNILKSNYN